DVHHRHVHDDHELSAEHDGQGDPRPLVTGDPRPPDAGDTGPSDAGDTGPLVARTVPVNPDDLSGIVSPMRSMRRRQDASIVFWHGFWHGCLVMRSDGRNGGLSMPSMPAWLCHLGRAIQVAPSPAAMEHRCGSGRPPVADR